MDAAGSIESTTTAAAIAAAAAAAGSINLTPLLALPEICTATSTPSLVSLPDDCAATVASFLRTQEIGVLRHWTRCRCPVLPLHRYCGLPVQELGWGPAASALNCSRVVRTLSSWY